LYTFTFTSCVAPYADAEQPETFQVH
jgi:hypothetical protein